MLQVLADTSYPRRVIPETQDGNQILDLGISDAVPPTQDQLTQVVEPVQACLETFAQTPIARSEVVLNVTRGATDPFSLGVRSAETNGGDLVADAFLAAYDTLRGRPPGCRRAARTTSSSRSRTAAASARTRAICCRPVAPPGEAITRLDTLNVLPFDNHAGERRRPRPRPT